MKNLYNDERKKRLKQFMVDVKKSSVEVERVLKSASLEIKTRLNNAPTDYQQWALTSVQNDISAVAEELKSDMKSIGAKGFDTAVNNGVAIVDEPLKTAFKYDLNAKVQQVNTAQLRAMKTFTVDRLENVADEAKKKITEQLGLVMIGVQSPYEAVQSISKTLTEKSTTRARTIVNTEMGRAFSVATHERMMQAQNIGLKMKKQWRRSGKIHSRLTHDLADGQVVDADEPFKVGGIDMMFPRDPTAPIGETINCGCVCLPYMDDWEVQHPADVPFTKSELDKSQEKRNVDDVRREDYLNWAKKLLNTEQNEHADGTSKVIAVIDDDIKQALALRGYELLSSDISISDRKLKHLSRTAKQKRGQTVDMALIKHLPDRIQAAGAVLLNKTKSEIIYAFNRGDGKYDKVSVNLRRTEDNVKNAKKRNWIITAGKVQAENMHDGIYELIKGSF